MPKGIFLSHISKLNMEPWNFLYSAPLLPRVALYMYTLTAQILRRTENRTQNQHRYALY